MDEKKPEENAEQQPENTQTAPHDALEKTNEELNAEAVNETGSIEGDKEDDAPKKKPNAFKAFMRKINIYLLGFLLVVVVAGATAAVSYLNSKKVPKAPDVASQQLTEEALKQLANSNATVGGAAETLTIQGNAILAGQVLAQHDLDVAGQIRVGGNFQAADLTVSDKANLADTQINSLQVATTTKIQGLTTLADLNVSGNTNFSGPVTASQITVSKLIMPGTAVLQIPNHLQFTGPPPLRAGLDHRVLGAGGTTNINGSDVNGSININTGGGPSAGCFVTVQFAQAFKNMPHVIVSPVGSGAGSLQYYVNKTTSGFSICTNNAPPANSVFSFDYFVTD